MFTAKFAAFQIGDDQSYRESSCLCRIRVGWRGDAQRIEADGDVADCLCGDKPALVEPVSGGADVRAVFGFRLLIAGRNVIGAHTKFFGKPRSAYFDESRRWCVSTRSPARAPVVTDSELPKSRAVKTVLQA